MKRTKAGAWGWGWAQALPSGYCVGAYLTGEGSKGPANRTSPVPWARGEIHSGWASGRESWPGFAKMRKTLGEGSSGGGVRGGRSLPGNLLVLAERTRVQGTFSLSSREDRLVTLRMKTWPWYPVPSWQPSLYLGIASYGGSHP